MNAEIQKFYRIVSLVGLVLFMAAAWFSVGFHHPDEHFQILEFCNYKLGNTPPADLAWEYQAQIRPGLPVFLAWVIIKCMSFVAITNPFVLAFILRLVVGLTAWILLKKITRLLLPQLKNPAAQKIALLMTFLLWFMPYLSVRFSSENLSALAFLAAVWFLLTSFESPKKMAYVVLAGLLLAFTFYLRYQMGFALLGLGLWLVFIKKIDWQSLSMLVLAGIAGLFLGFWADYWLYGEWVLTPVNYFTTNIVEDVASGFGVSPWWNYFYLFFLQAIPPISLVLLFFFFTGSFKSNKHVLLWCLVPFLLAHFAVGHKEMRFLFPMIFSFIFIVSVGIDLAISSGKFRKGLKIIFWVILTINVPLLVFRTFAPGRELLNYYAFLDDYAADKKMELVCFEHSIYRVVDVELYFYRSQNVTCKVMKDETAFRNYLQTEQPDHIYVLERKLQAESYPGYQVDDVYCVLPDWVLNINWNDWQSRAKIWKIRQLQKR